MKTTALFLAVLLWTLPAQACFGPKLFLGVPEDARAQVLTSIIAIYVKEKTGIETVRVNLDGKDAVAEIKSENLDYGLTGQPDVGLAVLVDINGLQQLVSGPRIFNDLQFTTVEPALRRLQGQLKPEHVDAILKQTEAGDLPMAAARRFLMQQRWI